MRYLNFSSTQLNGTIRPVVASVVVDVVVVSVVVDVVVASVVVDVVVAAAADDDDDYGNMAYQHIPTRHIPTRWEYDMMIRGGNVTLSYSHHIYYIYHYTYVWVICLSS